LVHCIEFKFVGVVLPEGGFCERVAVPFQRVFRLPRTMDDEAGAMVEPTAVAVHANRRGGVSKGMKVVVIGGGTIGLLIAQVARAYGAQKVVLSEPLGKRRALAKLLGFHMVCNPEKEDISFLSKKYMGAPDVVFDVVGTEKTLKDSLFLLRPNGKLVLIALPHTEGIGIPYLPIYSKELQVVSSRTYFKEDFPEAIRLLHAKRIEVRPMISRIFPMERFGEAIDLLEKEPEKYVKILIRPTA
jgi:2-desacetyl-2-hydroxyethyl bacteriochlorophyllide A dehydrogenase